VKIRFIGEEEATVSTQQQPTTQGLPLVRLRTLGSFVFEYFAGGSGANATRDYVITRMNEMNLFSDRGMLALEDISRVVLWLASDEARHITGYALPVDAGFLTR